MKKIVLIVVGVLVSVVILATVTAAVMIDPIVRRGVEKRSSAALKVPTRLNDASVRFSGRATLGRFQVDNPAGYDEPQALTFERVDVSVRPRELFQSAVDIREVTIVKPELTLEFAGLKNNLSVLMDNLPARGSEKGGKKFLIGKLRIENAIVRFRSNLLSGGTRTLTLPVVELERIGTAEGGATMGEILRVLLHTLGTAAVTAAEGILPGQLLDSLRVDLAGRFPEFDELRKKLEDLKSRPLDPARAERRLRELLEPKAD